MGGPLGRSRPAGLTVAARFSPGLQQQAGAVLGAACLRFPPTFPREIPVSADLRLPSVETRAPFLLHGSRSLRWPSRVFARRVRASEREPHSPKAESCRPRSSNLHG